VVPGDGLLSAFGTWFWLRRQRVNRAGNMPTVGEGAHSTCSGLHFCVLHAVKLRIAADLWSTCGTAPDRAAMGNGLRNHV
jgi:hypothetical protein